jgi:hypothetical protein
MRMLSVVQEHWRVLQQESSIIPPAAEQEGTSGQHHQPG